MCEVNAKRWWNHIYSFVIDDLRGDQMLLDVGCGSSPISTKSPSYVGIDVNRRCLPPKGNYLVADAHYLPFKKCTFDAVVLTEVLEHLICPSAAIQEAARVLRNEACLYLTTPNSSYIYYFLKNIFSRDLSAIPATYTEGGHLIEFDPRSLKRLLEKAHLKVVRMEGYLVPIPPRKRTLSTKLGWMLAEFFGRVFPLISSALLIKAIKCRKTINLSLGKV